MHKLIKSIILQQAKRLADEYQEYHNSIELLHRRKKRLFLETTQKYLKPPDYWTIDNKFNPFYVLKHVDAISKSIVKKLLSETYTPNPPHTYSITDRHGKMRSTTVYQIPDEAVSTYIYRHLLSKNKHRFSSLAYAYRDDRNVHYAVQDISYELQRCPRVFVAEFDFKDFFGSIGHEYLIKQLNSGFFHVSPFDLKLIKCFLPANGKGIHLGTSISLFLANAVCCELDRGLENKGLRFARYADDTIIWSVNYPLICDSFEILHGFSNDSGVTINAIKSEGISLLQNTSSPSEFNKTKDHINFLGYRLSGPKVSIKKSSVLRIKERISYILYQHLLQPLLSTPFRSLTIPNNNEDPAFVSSIMQIRRYIYGNLNDDLILKYLRGAYKRLKFKGLMSFYPLVNDEDQLIELDGWLLSTIFLVLRKRAILFKNHGHIISNQFPFNLPKSSLIVFCKNQSYHGRKGLMAIPSFSLIQKAIRKGVETMGVEEVMHPKSNSYNYQE